MVEFSEELEADLRRILGEVEVDGDGRIFYGGMRYVFLDQDLFMVSFEEMMNFMGASMKTLLYPSVELSGYAVARQLMDGGVPPERVIEAYAEYNNPRGWGLTEVVRVDLERPEVVVRMHNQYVSSWLKENVKDLEVRFPFYECGWGMNWVGAVKAALERLGCKVGRLVVEETECLARGGRFCEFVIRGEE
ncbi:MAG: hypothetical protein KIH01_07320 [Candidatus Freyarchaeota archaeon]|nr:hypothetical protein [Candidatus Jordarchaeia archaeon]